MRRRGGSWRDFGQRFACWNEERLRAISLLPREGLMWMHAVSVGEIGVAKKLITELLLQSPTQGIALTTTTPTGHALALDIEKSYPQRVVALYSPLDLPMVARRMLDGLLPAQIVLVEAEVWPNTLMLATRRGIPVTLVNARLSPRSERRYRRFASVIKPIFAMLQRVCVQEPEDVERWMALGLPRERITLTGSIKYDPQGADVPPAKVQKLADILQVCGMLNRPLLLAASTHAGEERAIGEVFKGLQERHPSLGLLIVPRHFERGAQVAEELRGLGLQPLRRSALPASPSAADVLVVDSTGELNAWQQLATLVIIGKSFLATGGQNPAEAVMAGKPVLLGPHMENFEPLVRLLLSAGGATQVPDLVRLSQAIGEFLARPELGQAQATAGKEALQRHHGATMRTATGLLMSF
jgi:3-deoxy-D-manno-octulosonic-acid transferase